MMKMRVNVYTVHAGHCLLIQSLQQHLEEGTIIIPILQMRKLRGQKDSVMYLGCSSRQEEGDES